VNYDNSLVVTIIVTW